MNTGRANEMAQEAVSGGTHSRTQRISDGSAGAAIRKQAVLTCCWRTGDHKCYVEVKNVTLLAEDGFYAFPDAVTERGRKHLLELIEVVRAGYRAAMLYVIPRSDGSGFRAAHEIDPAYADALDSAEAAGVEIHAWRAETAPEKIRLAAPVDYFKR